LFQFLVAGADRTTLEHAMIGIGCLIVYEGFSRWRHNRKPPGKNAVDLAPHNDVAEHDPERRRAA
jgi:hypothetical protein